jgi:hypothetical protein
MLLWVLTSVLLVLGWLYVSSLNKRRSSIPVVPGLPILGNAIALGKGGLAFITQCRQQVRKCRISPSTLQLQQLS